MIDKMEAETIIANNFDETRLKRIIRNTSAVSWGNAISEKQVVRWLENFNGSFFSNIDNERKLALWLLVHFTYYTYDDIRVLCRNLFNQFIHIKLGDYHGENLKEKYNEIIQDTIFVGLGNDSESGNNILYYFRQENKPELFTEQ